MKNLIENFKYYILILPLFVFVALFFLLPLLTVTTESVSDPIMANSFPHTTQELKNWNGIDKPARDTELAFMRDLSAVKDDQVMGEVVRRLNSNQAGFRTLMSKTISAVELAKQQHLDFPLLEHIDKRWDSVIYWRAISKSLPRYTDQFLLASIDYKRSPSGNIIAMPDGQSANLAIMWKTIWVSALVVFFCIVIGFPYSLIMVSVHGWKRQVLLFAVLLPLWTSLLVRTSAWYVILQDTGLINSGLIKIGLIDQPIHLLFNRVGVIIAMVHVLLPFMVLPIYGVLLTIPKNLMPAAESLGASPLRAFIHVMFPLSLRGIASGGLLVFISAIGYYITPALIGGAGDQMISSIIAFYALNSANWNMASALGVILLFATLVLYAFYSFVSNDKKI